MHAKSGPSRGFEMEDHAMYKAKTTQKCSTFPAMPGLPSLPASTMLDAIS